MKICGQVMSVVWQWKVNWEASGNGSGLGKQAGTEGTLPFALWNRLVLWSYLGALTEVGL